MKRVFTASMHHESNSFNPIIAGESEFTVIRGAEIFNRFKENDAATGIIKTLLAAGYEVVPSVFTSAVPNGEVDIDFYNKIKKEIIETAVAENKRQPLDAAALALHGSMYIHGLGCGGLSSGGASCRAAGNSDFLFARYAHNNDAAYAR